jgi:anti-anti-sigma regulatory factor
MGAIQVKEDMIFVDGPATVDIAAELRSVLAEAPAGGFRVDLSRATRIDTSIVQVLIAARRSLLPFRVVALPPTERERWERLGIATHLLSP